ncbi:lymphocyte cytosolic protein 2a isoform X3 [Amia ocellicauda]|uniref:lymphocyte cytosolic protein 2a isoform X3 n=1 Tax=Amia ocellicauda TaxID=2972642 RepID=UPI003464C7D5
MSFDSIPSRSEVMSWNANRLAEYLKSMDLKDCEKVVKKYSITGPRFLEMSENDLQKFPKLNAPLISRLSHDINKKEEKKGLFGKRTAAHKYREPEVSQDSDQGWDSEEFESDDYESPDAEDAGSGGDYESPTEGGGDSDYEPPPSDPLEDQTKIFPAKPICNNSEYIDNQNRGSSMKPSHSQPPAPPQRPGSSLPGFGNRMATCPLPPRRDESPQGAFRAPSKSPAAPPAPSVDRSKKPSFSGGSDSQPHLPAGRKLDKAVTPPRRPPAVEKPPDPHRPPKPPLPVDRNGSSVGRRPLTARPFGQDHRDETQDDSPMGRPPLPQPGGGAPFSSNTFPLRSKAPLPRGGLPGLPSHSDSLPPGGSLPSRLQSAVDIHRSHSRGSGDIRPPLPPPQPQRPAIVPEPEDEQDLDPQWYVAQVTRPEAEGCLRRVNHDGTFLVRDSSKRSAAQPYVLMVLYHNKVYNIQIRYQSEQDVFLLGTGLKGKENFTSVSEIIQHHMQAPLLLIDGKDRSSGQQRQCLLTYPAGY